MKKLLLLVMCGIALCACENPAGPPMRLAKNYIASFVKYEVIEVISNGRAVYSTLPNSLFDYEMPYIDILALPKRDTIINDNNRWNGYYFDYCNGKRDGCMLYDPYYIDKRIIYYEYINQIGDTCFNKIVFGGDPPALYAITIPLQTISITCDKDFNPDFPAGAELSSLFHVFFDDYYATIKNGYKTAKGSYLSTGGPYSHYNVEQSIFKEKLSEVNFSDRPFTGNEWLCTLDVAPDKTDEYTFHIKVTSVNGMVMEESTLPTKIEGMLD